MYLRHTTRVKDGKAHTYWHLVRSVRVGRKVVQQTVAQLGELDAEGRARARALAHAITGGREKADLFAPIPAEAPRFRSGWSASGWCGAACSATSGWAGRCGGPCSWIGRWSACCPRPRGGALGHHGPGARAGPIVRAVERGAHRGGLVPAHRPRRSAHAARAAGRGRPLLCALDRLLPHKMALEQHLVQRLGELFALDYELLLYDVPSTYFEGAAARNPLAQRGHSRDHRPDCKQVCLALVVTREGMPLGYELFAGNKTDVTTVKEIVGSSRFVMAIPNTLSKRRVLS